ncbi:MAG: hypothetical protein QM772_05770 [Ottowia sp.]|uniref:hypothetical protein n=1 Tax=Ottowia sp. TaxID=1898956 RepID=UPI0039E6AFBA
MNASGFRKIALLIENQLSKDAWVRTRLEGKYLSFHATDTGKNVNHRLFAYNSFGHVEKAGGPWLALNFGVGIRFSRIEEIIDEKINRPSSTVEPTRISLMGRIPDDTLYLGQFYLIDLSSDKKIEGGIDSLGRLYYEYLEPLRKIMRSESCFDDPFFYPEHDYGILGWELRRAAYYSATLDTESFASYVSRLKNRVYDYESGLGDDASLAAQTARRMLGDLRAFIVAVEQ